MTRQHLYYIRRTHLNVEFNMHLLVIESARYESFSKKSFMNYVQLTILVLEFFQLIAYPIREILDFYSNVDAYASTLPESLHINAKSGFSNSPLFSWFKNLYSEFSSSVTSQFYKSQIWTFSAIVLLLLTWFILLLAFFKSNSKYRVFVYFVPIINMIYLPVLFLFLSSMNCLSATETSLTQPTFFKCAGLNRPFYFLLSLTMYTVSYILFTLIISTFDNLPIKGEIRFKSNSVSLIKNLCLMISISFVYISDSLSHFKNLITFSLILTILCYNLRTAPSYVAPINHFRSLSFSCILWTCLIATSISNERIPSESTSNYNPTAALFFLNDFKLQHVFVLLFAGFLFLGAMIYTFLKIKAKIL
ncbi:hypothetical protein AYI70_g12428 [Smittium culicis]|uniref:Uncharacterized protein n=1 Tax=Smittium culicis TaxID=133412 RepID=A0A1R1WXJ1_9FUNG|nr:hypothetical protein AYI70_g12428 [Smittium culicis]